jgi:hypothetical protein
MHLFFLRFGAAVSAASCCSASCRRRVSSSSRWRNTASSSFATLAAGTGGCWAIVALGFHSYARAAPNQLQLCDLLL